MTIHKLKGNPREVIIYMFYLYTYILYIIYMSRAHAVVKTAWIWVGLFMWYVNAALVKWYHCFLSRVGTHYSRVFAYVICNFFVMRSLTTGDDF